MWKLQQRPRLYEDVIADDIAVIVSSSMTTACITTTSWRVDHIVNIWLDATTTLWQHRWQRCYRGRRRIWWNRCPLWHVNVAVLVNSVTTTFATSRQRRRRYDVDVTTMTSRHHCRRRRLRHPNAGQIIYLLLLMTFVRHKLRHAANAPSQPLHNNSYPRTGTFSVV